MTTCKQGETWEIGGTTLDITLYRCADGPGKCFPLRPNQVLRCCLVSTDCGCSGNAHCVWLVQAGPRAGMSFCASAGWAESQDLTRIVTPGAGAVQTATALPQSRRIRSRVIQPGESVPIFGAALTNQSKVAITIEAWEHDGVKTEYRLVDQGGARCVCDLNLLLSKGCKCGAPMKKVKL